MVPAVKEIANKSGEGEELSTDNSKKSGKEMTAHQVDEYIDIDDLLKAETSERLA